MAKVILICGKICCGKTTYSQKLCSENNAVLLSVDEITLALFGQHCGDKHDEYVERTEKYLLSKSLELIQMDINVVLDWGFWTKAERESVKEFYKSRNIECEFHYIDISDETWNEYKKFIINKYLQKKMKKRTQSIFLSLLMCLTILQICQQKSKFIH